MKKYITYVTLKTFVVFMLFPINSFSQTCEDNLSNCRNILRDVVETTYFNNKSTSKEFVAWWGGKWIHGVPSGVIRVHYNLGKVEPEDIGKSYNIYALPRDAKNSVILEVPHEEPGQEDPFKCASNVSKLKAALDEEGVSIDLNPYCSESYIPSEVDITLYWLSINDKPFVEIGTNGPACVPAMLYIYNKKTRKYELASEKCGG